MYRLKLEIKKTSASVFEVEAYATNLTDSASTLFIIDPWSGTLSFTLYDDKGNLITEEPLEPEGQIKYRTMELAGQQTGKIGSLTVDAKELSAFTATQFWDLEKFDQQTLRINATYKADEVLVEKISNHFNKSIEVMDIKSAPIKLNLLS